MRSQKGYLTYLDEADLTQEDRDIIKGFIDQRNTIKPLSLRTKGKLAYESVWVVRALDDAALGSCTVRDLLKAAGAASRYKKNSRQTKINTLKTLARYIHRFHHPIESLDLLTDDVKAGTAEGNTKKTLSLEEWQRVINSPMPGKRDKTRARAMIAMLYDGYHRPGEILLLRWSDLVKRDDGDIEYRITFKTELPRTIVQKSWTTKILRKWAAECGAVIGETPGPIFPNPLTGDRYHTIEPIVDLFGDLRESTGIPHLIPSVLRNTGIKHDVDAGLPVSYVCLRAWGMTYNKLINLYMTADSGRIQADQHRQGPGRQLSPVVDREEEDRIAVLEKKLRSMQQSQRAIEKYLREHQGQTADGP